MTYNKLEAQKKHVVREKKFDIFLFSVGLCLLLPCLLAAFSDVRGLLIAPIPAAVAVLAIRSMTENSRLLKQFSGIVENKAVNKTYEVKLYRPNIRLLTRSEARPHGSLSRVYYGMTVTDPHKKKYYYFFDEGLRHDEEGIRRIREKLYRGLSIQCYENTSIIRTVENDPHFLRIRFGAFYG